MQKYLLAVFTGVYLLLVTACQNQHQVAYLTEHGYAQGTTYTVKYDAKPRIPNLQKDLRSLLDSVDRSMSTYLPTSDISRINKGTKEILIDRHFRKVYDKAREVWEKTGGRFDPTVGALVNAWGFGEGASLKSINQQQIDSLLQFTGFDKVSITEKGTVQKQHPSVYLDFNALAQGYTVDLIDDYLKGKGTENYLVEIGGEVYAKGSNPKTKKNWVVAIDDPLRGKEERPFAAKIRLKDRALATSGSYRKYKINKETGRRYTHIIDPKTGYPEENTVLSVSVLAPTCMEADAYATAFMLTPVPEFKKLLTTLKDVDVYAIYTQENGERGTFITKGFSTLLVE